MTAQQMSDARDWAADCFEDYDPDASDGCVMRVVERCYEGGLAGFLADGKYGS
jgi:hypothetical protein